MYVKLSDTDMSAGNEKLSDTDMSAGNMKLSDTDISAGNVKSEHIKYNTSAGNVSLIFSVIIKWYVRWKCETLIKNKDINVKIFMLI